MVTTPAQAVDLALPQIEISDVIAVAYGAEPTHMRRSGNRVVNAAYKLDHGDLVVDLNNYDAGPHPYTIHNAVRVQGTFTLNGTIWNIHHTVFIGKDGTGSTMLSREVKLEVAFPQRRYPTYQMGLVIREGFRGLADVEKRGEGPMWIKLPGTASWARAR